MGVMGVKNRSGVKQISALKAERHGPYFAIGKVYSRVLREDVYFNNHGFKHLMFDGNGRRRKEADIRMRLNLLPCAPVVVARSRASVDRIITAGESRAGKEVIFYQLQHTIRSKLNPLRTIPVIVIVRRVGKGQLHFFSIRIGRNKE